MDESRSPAEISSIDCFNKKRKLQDELLELPLSKHACWHQNPIVVFPSDCYNTERNKEESDESDQESAKDSNSFHCNGDSIMSTDHEFKTDLEYLEIYEPSISSASWAGTSAEIQFYPSMSRSLTKPNPSRTESLSLSEQINHYPYYQRGTEASLNYKEDLEEFGNDSVEESMDKEPGNYVLSSGRWSVNDRDTRQEKNQLTIDKEFEQYFSMLMM